MDKMLNLEVLHTRLLIHYQQTCIKHYERKAKPTRCAMTTQGPRSPPRQLAPSQPGPRGLQTDQHPSAWSSPAAQLGDIGEEGAGGGLARKEPH